MKNNCDVSGIMAECKGEKTCMYVKKDQDCIFLSGYGTICCNLAAIRAAIEAERDVEGRAFIDAMGKAATDHIVDANKTVSRDCENCKHSEGPAMKGPCENCVVMHNWEPADAGEKGE